MHISKHVQLELVVAQYHHIYVEPTKVPSNHTMHSNKHTQDELFTTQRHWIIRWSTQDPSPYHLARNIA
jgi:hypothetical protein